METESDFNLIPLKIKTSWQISEVHVWDFVGPPKTSVSDGS